MKYLSESGLRHLISKIMAKFTELENTSGGTEISTSEIDTMWEDAA